MYYIRVYATIKTECCDLQSQARVLNLVQFHCKNTFSTPQCIIGGLLLSDFLKTFYNMDFLFGGKTLNLMNNYEYVM